MSFYTNDNNDTFPDADWDDDGQNDPRGQWWFLPLRPYYEDQPDIMLCAKADKKQDINSAADWVADGRYFPQDRDECWGRKIIDEDHPDYGEWFWSSYAPNSWLMDPSEGTWGAPLPTEAFWRRLTNVKQRSQVPFFVESSAVDVWPHHTDEPNSEEFGVNDGRGSMRALTLLRHGTKTNIVFMDGSLRKVDIKELWGFKWHQQYDRNYPDNPYTQDDAPWPSWMR
ncbi:hypothetical protein [Anaerohalosphaera lusitana]|nr:hypothetical protein [Anaerohalosphaera lusitana]